MSCIEFRFKLANLDLDEIRLLWEFESVDLIRVQEVSFFLRMRASY